MILILFSSFKYICNFFFFLIPESLFHLYLRSFISMINYYTKKPLFNKTFNMEAKKKIIFVRSSNGYAERTFLPFLLRRARTLRPFLVLILSRKPCTLARLRLLGWYVRFTMYDTSVKSISLFLSSS